MLPEGWRKTRDPARCRTFYVNAISGPGQWERPQYPASELPCEEAAHLQVNNALIEVEAEVADPNDDTNAVVVEAAALDVPRTGQRKRKKRNTSITAEEAISQAASEGLVLVKSATSVTGYAGVRFDNRIAARGAGSLPYALYGSGSGGQKGNFLGCFATAEEAALAYARSIGNTAARVVHAGCMDGTKRALSAARVRTGVCSQDGCGALVDWGSPKNQLGLCAWCSRARGADRKKHLLTQLRMADALGNGDRKLCAEQQQPWAPLPSPAVEAAVEAARRRVKAMQANLPKRGRPTSNVLGLLIL